jgi:hypothetical protein
MLFKDNEETQNTESFMKWLKITASKLSEIPGVDYVETSQNNPFTFLAEKDTNYYPFQLDIRYRSEEDFNKANENFANLANTDPYLMEELIRVEPFCDIHVCYVEKVSKIKKVSRRFFGLK